MLKIETFRVDIFEIVYPDEYQTALRNNQFATDYLYFNFLAEALALFQ